MTVDDRRHEGTVLALAVYIRLRGDAWYTTEALAQACGVSVRTIQRVIRALRRGGAEIEQRHHEHKNGGPLEYHAARLP